MPTATTPPPVTTSPPAATPPPPVTTPSPPVTTPPQPVADSAALKAQLAELMPADERDRFLSPPVSAARVDAPFLRKAELYRIESRGHHLIVWFIGRIPGTAQRTLASDADWEWLRREGGVHLETDVLRLGYIRAFFDVQMALLRRYAWRVDTVDELRLFTSTAPGPRPPASSEEEAAKARIIDAKYRPIIKPLALVGPSLGPWHGIAYANGRHQKIVQVDVTLGADGALTLKDTVLEEHVPIPGVFP